jgi:hypothetical protein
MLNAALCSLCVTAIPSPKQNAHATGAAQSGEGAAWRRKNLTARENSLGDKSSATAQRF